jgi:hypothetical protein
MKMPPASQGRAGGHHSEVLNEQEICGKQACAIQWCLAKQNYQESACREFIDAWKKCSERVKEKQKLAQAAHTTKR